MSNLTNFKEFVKRNPCLIKYVKSGEMNWQKFYEIYDLYGEENSAWNNYIVNEDTEQNNNVKNVASPLALGEVVTWLKSMDINKMQEGINSVQRVVSVLQDFGKSEAPKTTEYKPRPVYKHFED